MRYFTQRPTQSNSSFTLVKNYLENRNYNISSMFILFKQVQLALTIYPSSCFEMF